MVGGLVLAWLPMNLINLWRDFAPSNNFSTWYTLIFAACHVVSFVEVLKNTEKNKTGNFLVLELISNF